MEHLTIAGEQVAYAVRKAKGKRISLGFENGQLLVVTPSGQLQDALPFIEQKARWILKHYRRQAAHAEKMRTYKHSLLQQVDLLGKQRKLLFNLSQGLRYKLEGDQFVIFAPEKYLEQPKVVLYHALRQMAKTYLSKRTYELAAITESDLNTVRIKSHRSKWGSCSSKRNLNLNWHLVLMEKGAIDYVIIHELMHLREMNHSKRFWDHVATYFPDYKKAIRILAQEQWKIGIYD